MTESRKGFCQRSKVGWDGGTVRREEQRDPPPISQVLQQRLAQEISTMEHRKDQLLMESETWVVMGGRAHGFRGPP